MTKIQPVSMNELWESAPVCDRSFNPAQLTHLPAVARRCLEAAIAPGTALASAVRLWMQGAIKLG